MKGGRDARSKRDINDGRDDVKEEKEEQKKKKEKQKEEEKETESTRKRKMSREGARIVFTARKVENISEKKCQRLV